MASSAKSGWHFALAIVSAVFRGRLRFSGGHRPPDGHFVGRAFAGVGVAASDDPAVDDFIVEQLRWAGLRHVRLDFTVDDEGGPGARLLERLIAAGIHVTLHLMQRREDALQMPSRATEDAWRAFVVRSLDRYGAAIEMVELGSTTNRQRWCGHSLAGFLAMWGIGWQEVRARGLTLVGPSVTDFEPPWNIGLLSLLADRRQLPDLHSDNLFSERCTEPERFDHKILGPRLASLHKFNLIKKARLLARLGADIGVPRLVSPAAFWTLPRIERTLPDSEQKQADYLARYMVLCAASGALERAWWGPLICHREGLVDNGPRPYPAQERITRYASVEGELVDLRVRPALHALRTFADLIPGSRYEGRQIAGEGLEVHAFRTSRHLLHIVWTVNGGAAALDELYASSDLAIAEFLDRDGRPECAEAACRILVCESPRYVRWAANRTVFVNDGVALMAGCSLAVHSHKGLRPFLFRDAKWRGIVLAESLNEYQRLAQALHPGALIAPDRKESMRHARNVIWKVADPIAHGESFVVKKPLRMPAYRRFFDRNKPVKGMRAWSGTCELLRIGVDAAAPVAYFELCDDHTRTENFYICRYVPSEVSVREMVAAINRGDAAFFDVPVPEMLRALARYVLRMHNGGVYFRDLSAGNILVRTGERDGPLFSLIDTGRIHMCPEGVSLRQRLSDLARICNKLHQGGRRDLLAAYFSGIGRSVAWYMHLPLMIYDLKVWTKRKIGRKALKRAMRRNK